MHHIKLEESDILEKFFAAEAELYDEISSDSHIIHVSESS
jgi:hypothetical protein